MYFGLGFTIGWVCVGLDSTGSRSNGLIRCGFCPSDVFVPLGPHRERLSEHENAADTQTGDSQDHVCLGVLHHINVAGALY